MMFLGINSSYRAQYSVPKENYFYGFFLFQFREYYKYACLCNGLNCPKNLNKSYATTLIGYSPVKTARYLDKRNNN